jgi:hypothetical protein
MKKYNQYIYILFLCVVASCTKDATNVKLPKVESQIVAQCFIAAGDPQVIVSVSESTPIYGKIQQNTGSTLQNCKVIINNGTKDYTIPFDVNLDNYILFTNDLKIEAGKTYTLKVTDTAGRSVTATCTVPLQSFFSGAFVSFDSTEEKFNGQGTFSYRIKYKINDDVTTTNNYRILFDGVYEYYDYIRDANGKIIDSTLLENTNAGTEPNTYNNEIFLRDESNVAFSANYVVDFPAPLRWNGSGGGGPSIGHYKSFKMYIVNGDLGYYKYHESVQSFYNSEGNPFAEPVIIYNNIQGGIGIFAAYQTKEFVKIL